MRRPRGFTLIELLVVVSVVAIVAAIAAPSFSSFIVTQRLKSVNAQLVTDMQFARSEAAARNQLVRVRFDSDTNESCYVISIGDRNACSCTTNPVCTAAGTEIRTVRIPADRAVQVAIASGQTVADFGFDPATGEIRIPASDARGGSPSQFGIDTYIDDARKLRTVVALSGRPQVCKPTGSSMTVPACN